jgi:hypothetical protein
LSEVGPAVREPMGRKAAIGSRPTRWPPPLVTGRQAAGSGTRYRSREP